MCQSGPADAPVTLTWRQWHDAATTLAQSLRQRTEPGAVILLGIGNHPAFHIAFLGAILADRQAMVMSPECTASEIEAALTRTGAAGVIGAPTFLARTPGDHLLRLARDELLTPSVSLASATSAAAWARPEACEGRGAVLLASSGTTGRPKIVQRLTPSLDGVGHGCAQGIGFQSGDCVLLTIPVHHSYGLEHGLLAPLIAGTPVELVATFHANHVLERLRSGAITILPSVPFIFEALAQAHQRLAANANADADTHAAPLPLRRAYSAGGPLPMDVFHAWQRTLGVRLGQLYGSTEVGSVTFNDPSDEEFDSASVGVALPGAELRVLDRNTPRPDRPLPPGEEGRVAVASKGMMRGYVDQPSDDIVDGLFLTNDLGRLDARGRLTLTGRFNLLIDIDGRKVNPADVESVLASHPDVAEAVVLAMPMTPTVNRLKAIVVPHAGATVEVEALRRFARARLSGYKLPRLYEVRHHLPRTATGKIKREALQCS